MILHFYTLKVGLNCADLFDFVRENIKFIEKLVKELDVSHSRRRQD